MKGLKKLLTGILTATMLLSMGLPVSATGVTPTDNTTKTYTMIVTNKDAGHTYEAYQIFSGDLSEKEGKNVLSSIKWGSGVDGADILNALQNDATFRMEYTGITDADKVADILSKYDTAKAQKFADIVGKHLSAIPKDHKESQQSDNPDGGYQYKIEGLPAGYYFVKDKDTTVDSKSAYTDFIMNIVGDTTAVAKSDVPTVAKKVKEESYTGDDGYDVGYNDVADYNIGDNVPFELIGTLPNADNFAAYTKYQYTFTDTLSDGLTYNDDAQVTIDGKDVTSRFTISNLSNQITISIADIKSIKDENNKVIMVTAASKVIVKYTARLNANATIGQDGNLNDVKLTYSNNPNGDGIGTTPRDYVVVFTYEVDTTKRAEKEDGLPLKDAQFILYRINAKTNKTEAVTVTDGKVTGWTDVNLETDPTKTTDAVNANLLSKNKANILTSADNGLFVVSGLDEGTYYLREIKAPTGYNILKAPVTLQITANKQKRQNWTYTKAEDTKTALTSIDVNGVKIDTDKSGVIDTTVVNNSGATLPSTGGIGTTIFYLIGGIMILGAFVTFIVKRKMTANK